MAITAVPPPAGLDLFRDLRSWLRRGLLAEQPPLPISGEAVADVAACAATLLAQWDAHTSRRAAGRSLELSGRPGAMAVRLLAMQERLRRRGLPAAGRLVA
jgi:hypothetical protein